ncbi:hypothetical protein K450DRAFT_264123 [Umbelopsis ramanniana AG]|uniref:Uncharacterized protein n=1 Tax=Umbelopsis ramanniana AG TaxID=1314678 RepID=A0AAD5E3L6_UMBRA|nr:uncharacterized protein K450DRAFT_264123 [Umbelopsis ramanniana AG]KAI8574915.1 hypothetical protein K450DRAFT_264123 [Umbelopsis ramanniana AG]
MVICLSIGSMTVSKLSATSHPQSPKSAEVYLTLPSPSPSIPPSLFAQFPSPVHQPLGLPVA